eukprot:1657621-Amphidinium_carterae.1
MGSSTSYSETQNGGPPCVVRMLGFSVWLPALYILGNNQGQRLEPTYLCVTKGLQQRSGLELHTHILFHPTLLQA